ncbi:MAG: right-handed parallel beta-helix repeat-containing protein [Phaeodactylibacter sp.]|nr:right-handed parallel beta-helix repeat-containing protein [Phaeodactylibacter sp.]
MKRTLIFIAIALMAACRQAPTPLIIHVAPDGKTGVPGTSDQPTTLESARDQIRRLHQEGVWPAKGVVVELKEGIYHLDAPLKFGPQDGGRAGGPVTYRSASSGQAILSAGRAVAGWKAAGDNLWKTTLPAVASGQWYFRQLFAGGRRLTRARTPNEGWFYATGPLEEYKGLIQPWQFGKMTEVRRDYPEAICGFGIEAGDLRPWPDMKQAEVLWLNSWDASWHSIRSLDTVGREIRFNSPANWTVGFYPGLPRYRVENVREALDQPGEWYLNKTSGELFYLAEEGDNPNEMSFFAPVSEQLLVIEGSPGKPVEHLQFEGIRFSHTAYPMGIYAHTVHQEDIKPPYTSLFWDWPAHARRLYPDWPTDFLPGYTEPQAAVHAGQAIEMRFAGHVGFRYCTFSQLGAHAVRFGKGTRHSFIENSAFEDLGGGGVYIGMPISDYRIAGLKEEETPAFNRIERNQIRHGGKVHPGAVGLWLAQAHDNQILNNEIAHFGYSGVSIGWTWGSKESYARDNIFARNEIHHVMEVLADGGAFYSLGILPGNVYRENYIHHVSRDPGAIGSHNNGMFFDEGSAGIRVESNVIHDIADEVIRFNASHDSSFVFANNYFDVDSIQVKANYDYNTLEAANDAKYVRIRIPGNHYGVKPGTEAFPTEIAARAGARKN